MSSCEDFADLHDPSLVRYEEYCDCLAQFARGLGFGNTGSGRQLGSGSNTSDPLPVFDRQNVDRFIRHASPKERRDFESVVAALQRVNSGGNSNSNYDDYDQPRRDDYDRPSRRSYDDYGSSNNNRDSRDYQRREPEREDRYAKYRESRDNTSCYDKYDKSSSNTGNASSSEEQYWWQREARGGSRSPERTRDSRDTRRYDDYSRNKYDDYGRDDRDRDRRYESRY